MDAKPQSQSLLERIMTYTGMIIKDGDVSIPLPKDCTDWVEKLANAPQETRPYEFGGKFSESSPRSRNQSRRHIQKG